MGVAARVDPLLQRLQAGKPQTAPVIPIAKLRDGEIHIGDQASGQPVGLSIAKIVEGRLLLHGISGTGKSWTLRRLLEQTEGAIQQIVIDPEGEFRGYAEERGLLHLDGARLDIATLAVVAVRLREHRASAVLDLSDLEPEQQMQAATAFIKALIGCPKEHWHPALVAVDEAQRFAPHGGYTDTPAVRKASVAAMADLMTRGRKRGLGAIVATHRLAQLAKSVAQPVLNFMIGCNTLDLDIQRAAQTIGWSAKKAFDRLPTLAPGEFVVTGPAFSVGPTQLNVGPVQTKHVGATPRMTAPNRVAPAAAAELVDLEGLMAATAADQQMLDQRAQPVALRALRGFIRDKAFPDAGRVFGELAKLRPDGARLDQLAKHLNRSADEIAVALALLDKYGAVEFDGEGNKRAARVAPDFFQ